MHVILSELSALCTETINEIDALAKATPDSNERAEISGELSVLITRLKIKTTLIEEAMEAEDWSI